MPVALPGAGDGIRTRECELGKLVPYHLATPAIAIGNDNVLFQSMHGYVTNCENIPCTA